MLPYLNSFLLLVSVFFLLTFSIRNFRDGYLRAGSLAVLVTAASVCAFLLFFDWELFHFVFLSVWLLLFLLFSVPYSKFDRDLNAADADGRFDERDISFSRSNLIPGSENYISYYRDHPEKEAVDARTRALPGLLAEGSKYFHRLNSGAADASFFLLSHLSDSVDGPVSDIGSPCEAGRISDYLKKLAEHYGASYYAVAKIGAHHYYSHSGRGMKYGTQIPVRHRYAIVFGSEMKSGFTATAPLSPEVVEVGRRYVDCAVWAVQAASFIRNQGFSARAHIDGCYQVIPPLVANETGSGGFGWSSLFLTEKYGPRLRFSVVTTDLELSVSDKKKQLEFLSFCNICRKCAENCPSRAINKDKLEKVNADRCFSYWNAVGTDCGKCLAVCPMGHPWGVLKSFALRSLFAGRLLKLLDDLFYGSKPASLHFPSWMDEKL